MKKNNITSYFFILLSFLLNFKTLLTLCNKIFLFKVKNTLNANSYIFNYTFFIFTDKIILLKFYTDNQNYVQFIIFVFKNLFKIQMSLLIF